MRCGLLYKYIFICSLFFYVVGTNSTPTIREPEEKFDHTIEKIAEIIYESHNIDIENRSLNYGYYGYQVEHEDNCKVILRLMDYSKKELFFNVDFCKNRSNFFKIKNHELLPKDSQEKVMN